MALVDLGPGFRETLTELKAIPSTSLIPGIPIMVLDHNGANIPSWYVYYSGSTLGDEPEFVASDDGNGYFVKGNLESWWDNT